jgi:hypothetical protein
MLYLDHLFFSDLPTLFLTRSTVGEWALLLAVLALFAFWAVYFSSLIHQRVIDDEQGDDSRLGLNVAARVTGHCAVLALALLMFPTARNSMWCAFVYFFSLMGFSMVLLGFRVCIGMSEFSLESLGIVGRLLNESAGELVVRV